MSRHYQDRLLEIKSEIQGEEARGGLGRKAHALIVIVMQQSEGDGGEQGRGVARKDDSGEEGHGAGGDGVEGQGKLLKASDREALQAALRNCVMQQVRREHGREKEEEEERTEMGGQWFWNTKEEGSLAYMRVCVYECSHGEL